MPKRLFSRLLSLFPDVVPEEDFFTEMVGWLFDQNPKLFYGWLKKCLHLNVDYTGLRVETQMQYEKLEGHQTASRPDIVAFLYEGEDQDIVMIESKLGAKEGYDQLARYAGHLSAFTARRRILIYISRSYDPKDLKQVMHFVKDSNVDFIPLHWYDFYQYLKEQPPEPLLKEVMQFMKERHMAKITRITPGVLMAINAYPDVYNLFHDVLDGEVSARFEKVIGMKPVAEKDRWWNVSNWRRYLLLASLDQHLTFFCGFVMPDQNEEYPSVRAYLEINAKSSDWGLYAQTLKRIIGETALSPIQWSGYNLDQPKQYAGISTQISFEEILMEADHISALKKRFFLFLEDYERLLKTYPELQRKQ